MPLQDKESCVAVLDNQDYIEKSDYQLGRSWFEKHHNPFELFSEKVNLWIKKWTGKKVLDRNQSKLLDPSVVAPRKMYGLVKT